MLSTRTAQYVDTLDALWPLVPFEHGFTSESSTPSIFLGHIRVPQLFMVRPDNPHKPDIKIAPWFRVIAHEMKVHRYVDTARHLLLKIVLSLFIV